MYILKAVARIKSRDTDRYTHYILMDEMGDMEPLSIKEIIKRIKRKEIQVDNLVVTDSVIRVKPGVKIPEKYLEDILKERIGVEVEVKSDLKGISADEAIKLCKNKQIDLKPMQVNTNKCYIGSISPYNHVLIIPDNVTYINTLSDINHNRSDSAFSQISGHIKVFGGRGLSSQAAHGMFYRCKSLRSLDLSNFNTSNITDMKEMFFDCMSLESMDLRGLDTSKVKDMGGMFVNCINLQSLDVSNFNTSNVTDMSHMFAGCKSLQSLDVSNFNTSNVTDMSYMFSACGSLQSLDLSHFDTSKVTDMRYMFINCSKLQSLDLSNFNTSKLKKQDMNGMFDGCSSLQSVAGNSTGRIIRSVDYMHEHYLSLLDRK